jgi:Holliday junction DNA helicase RuvA
MITHLSGKLARLNPDGPSVDIDVQGIRYEVLVPLFLWPELAGLMDGAEAEDPSTWQPVALHTIYHATANLPVPVLVGFLRRPERDFFRKFTTVEGIGPVKAAKAMTVSVSTIARAIEQEDRAVLTRLPGIGPRAADKIIASLRGKVTAEAALQDGGIDQPVDVAALQQSSMAADAIAAIVALGFGKAEAAAWVEESLAASPDIADVEELTLSVLRARAR